MAQNEQLNDVLIADQTKCILTAMEKLSKDPYTQMAVFKSAAAVVQNRLEAAGVKAAMAMALTSVVKPQY
jgi:hypothetical protein